MPQIFSVIDLSYEVSIDTLRGFYELIGLFLIDDSEVFHDDR